MQTSQTTYSFKQAVSILQMLGLEHGDHSVYYIPNFEGSMGFSIFSPNNGIDDGFYFQLYNSSTTRSSSNPVYFTAKDITLFQRIVSMMIEANKWSSDNV